MEIIYYPSVFNVVTARLRSPHDNDNAPPAGGTPVALPGPLPPSIVFPMKLANGAI
jgi:hypothetical protein